jgi:hypothetical protein
MKKQILTVGAAVLFALGSATFTSCGSSETTQEDSHAKGGHDHGDGHSHDHSAALQSIPSENTEEFSGEKAQDLSLILGSYFELKNALVEDNSEATSAAAKKLLGSFTGFDESTLEEAQVSEYAEIEESAVENAQHIVKNKGVIDHQREHLGALSEDMNDLVSLIGTDMKLYLDHCPMANDNEGAVWLSETEEISNSYMGESMPTCGTIQKEIN